MKKKLALALAAVMSVSAFSGFSASAASASVTTLTKAYAKNQVTVMDGAKTYTNSDGNTAIDLDSSRVVYQGGIPYLQLNFTDNLTDDLDLNLELTGAEFNMYNSSSKKGVNYNFNKSLNDGATFVDGGGYTNVSSVTGIISDSDVKLAYVPTAANEVGYTFTPWMTEKNKATVSVEANTAYGLAAVDKGRVSDSTTSASSLDLFADDSASTPIENKVWNDTAGTAGTGAYVTNTDYAIPAQSAYESSTAASINQTVKGDTTTFTAQGTGALADSSTSPVTAITTTADPVILVVTYAKGDSTLIVPTMDSATVSLYTGSAKSIDDISGAVKYTGQTDAGTYYAYAYNSAGDQLFYKHTATVEQTSVATATVGANNYIRIPLVMRFTDTGTVSVTVSGSRVSAFNGTYVLSAAGSGTTLTAKSVVSGKNTVTLDRITLRENAAGAFKANGTATLELNNYVEFKTGTVASDGSIANAKVTANYMYDEGTSTNNLPSDKIYETEAKAWAAAGQSGTDYNWSNIPKTYMYLNSDKTAIVIRFGSNLTTLTAPSYASIYIDDLVVQGEGGDAPSNGTVATLTSKNTSSAGVTEQTVDVAKFTGYTLNYSAADAVSIYAGDLKSTKTTPNGLVVAKVTVEEGIANRGWWVDTETAFTLTDAEGNKLNDVKFAEVKVDYDNVDDIGKIDDTWLRNVSTGYNESDYWYYSKDGNVFYLNAADDDEEDSNVGTTKAKAVLTIYLSANAGFEGDVYLHIGGDAVPSSRENIENNGIVKIATVKSKVTMDTKVTEVQVGYQTYAVADVTITEAEPGLLSKDENLYLGIGEFGVTNNNDDIYFNPITADQVTTTGDIKVTPKTTVESNLTLTVDKRSTTASTITLSNLAIKIDRRNPVGTYELNLYGPAVIKNDNEELNGTLKSTADGYKRYGFDYASYAVSDYVKVVSETGFDVLTQEVTIYQNSTAVLVDGVTMELDAPTKNVDGRLYVPLRFLSLVFGATNQQIVWDDETRNVQITIGGTTVTWTQDSEYYVKGGVRMAMTEDGVVSKAFISTDDDESNGRTYIPFRYFGYAFGIDVDYDEATGAATYNKKVDTTITTSTSTAE